MFHSIHVVRRATEYGHSPKPDKAALTGLLSPVEHAWLASSITTSASQLASPGAPACQAAYLGNTTLSPKTLTAKPC